MFGQIKGMDKRKNVVFKVRLVKYMTWDNPLSHDMYKNWLISDGNLFYEMGTSVLSIKLIIAGRTRQIYQLNPCLKF